MKFFWVGGLCISLVILSSCAEEKVETLLNKKNDNKVEKATPKVIYGADDRLDIYQVSDTKTLQMANSTVALIANANIQDLGDGTSRLSGRSFGDYYNLCASEPFRDQPVDAFCSGFLVGEDLIATAGHCIRSQSDCQDVRFAFNYAVTTPGKNPNLVENKNLYKCQQIIRTEVNGSGSDFAIIKLDRPVSGRTPLKIRRTGQIPNGANLLVIGHPAGLPTKVAGGAQVRSQGSGYFTANLDTYGGNSGSAVFNAVSGEVEGILVRGETDFIYSGGCRASNRCTDNGCRGEDVTRITEALNYIPAANDTPESPTLEDKEFRQTTPLDIPDNNITGATSSVRATEAPLGRKVEVELNVAHSWRGDLLITLEAPNGQKVILHNREGSWRNDIYGIYGVSLEAFDNLAPLSTVNATGEWKLHISDHAQLDQGRLISWALHFKL